MRRALAASLGCLCAVTLAACGTARVHPPNVATAKAPAGLRAVNFGMYGLSFGVPVNWDVRNGTPPLVVTLVSGRATLAVWRYPRSEPLPRDTAALRRAGRALVAAARRRDPSLRLERPARLVAVRGMRGVELRAVERVGGESQRVRSLHFFDRGSEIVVDAFASADQFTLLDTRVVEPLLGSLRLFRPGT